MVNIVGVSEKKNLLVRHSKQLFCGQTHRHCTGHQKTCSFYFYFCPFTLYEACYKLKLPSVYVQSFKSCTGSCPSQWKKDFLPLAQWNKQNQLSARGQCCDCSPSYHPIRAGGLKASMKPIRSTLHKLIGASYWQKECRMEDESWRTGLKGAALIGGEQNQPPLDSLCCLAFMKTSRSDSFQGQTYNRGTFLNTTRFRFWCEYRVAVDDPTWQDQLTVVTHLLHSEF